MYSPVHTVGGSSLPSGWERILGQGHFHPPTCAGATIRAQKVDKSKTIHFDKMCTGHSGTSLPMGHPGQAGTVLTDRRQNILTMKVQAKRHEPPPGASGSGRFHAVGVEKHQVVISRSAEGNRSADGMGCRAEQGGRDQGSEEQAGEREGAREAEKRGRRARDKAGLGLRMGMGGRATCISMGGRCQRCHAAGEWRVLCGSVKGSRPC